MGEGKLKTFRDPISTITGPYYSSLAASRNRWVDMEADDDASDLMSSTSSSTFYDESSNTSNASSSFEELVDDASSSSSSTNGPLYELSDLMATLPIKRGLSKHFQGKSQSFTSLSDVSCIEDLVKKENGYGRKKMITTCKSYGGGLDIQKKVISKKNTKSNSAPRFIGSPRRPPLIPAKRSTVFAISQS